MLNLKIYYLFTDFVKISLRLAISVRTIMLILALLSLYSNNDMNIIGEYIFMNSGNGNGTGDGSNFGTGDTGHNSGGGSQGPGSEQTLSGSHTFNRDRNEDIIYNWMRNKLDRHRLNSATTASNDSTMGDKFTALEHDYVCDKIADYLVEHPNSQYRLQVFGEFPNRIFTGRVSRGFLDTIFPVK